MKAVVLLSGGLDSTVTLAYSISKGYEVVPMIILYGQRHAKELDAARNVVAYYGLKTHVLSTLDLSSFQTSALTSHEVHLPTNRTVDEMNADVPTTYVPARNLIFLSMAAGLCESIGASSIFLGANALDFSGYPDCRPEFFHAFENVLAKGTKTGIEGKSIRIHHPLINMSKADIIRLGKELKAPLWLTWSCYAGQEEACGVCDACILRIKGFEEAGIVDEIAYQ